MKAGGTGVSGNHGQDVPHVPTSETRNSDDSELDHGQAAPVFGVCARVPRLVPSRSSALADQDRDLCRADLDQMHHEHFRRSGPLALHATE